jgi:hypothetical protein
MDVFDQEFLNAQKYRLFDIQSTYKVTYYAEGGQKVRHFGMYVPLGSKFGSFPIVGTKNDVRYFRGYFILGVRYFGSRLYQKSENKTCLKNYEHQKIPNEFEINEKNHVFNA